MGRNKTYLFVSRHDWAIDDRRELESCFPGACSFVSSEESLFSYLNENGSSTRYIFFLHWSLRVPKKIYASYECVCHMTDVPYGRGGTPLQNLILRGHSQTKLSALRMVDEMDAGPVYTKKSLSLEEG